MKEYKTIIGEKYLLSDEKRGFGNAASVYAARTETGASYAVKLYRAGADAEQLARFRQEAIFLKGLRSPYIVPYIDSGDTVIDGEERPYLVMGLSEHGSIADYLADGHIFSLKDGLASVLRGAMGLEAVHQAGIVHRDFKPENVLLNEESSWLIDFDIATHPGKDDVYVAGTLAYMSPERLHSGLIDPRGDTYAAGATLFQVLSGRLPYEPTEEHKKLSITAGNEWQILHAEPQTPSLVGLDNTDFPDKGLTSVREVLLGRIIDTALAREAADRPTPLEFVKDIQALYRETEGKALPVHIDLFVPPQPNFATLGEEPEILEEQLEVPEEQPVTPEPVTASAPIKRVKTIRRRAIAFGLAASLALGLSAKVGMDIFTGRDKKEVADSALLPKTKESETPPSNNHSAEPAPSPVKELVVTPVPSFVSESPSAFQQAQDTIVVYPGKNNSSETAFASPEAKPTPRPSAANSEKPEASATPEQSVTPFPTESETVEPIPSETSEPSESENPLPTGEASPSPTVTPGEQQLVGFIQ